jgi:quercetin dioxygenase-like cupin family protein
MRRSDTACTQNLERAGVHWGVNLSLSLRRSLAGLASAWCLLTCSSVFAADVTPTPAAAAPVRAQVILQTTQTWAGDPIAVPAGPLQLSVLTIQVAPGADTGWHVHPMANFAYVLEGELEVRMPDGRVRRLVAGEALAEVVQRVHAGRNTGRVPTKLVVFYLGTPSQPLSSPADPH